MDTNLSATEIAKLAAMMTGGGFKRSATKESAIARFLKIAAEQEFGSAEEALGMPDFDAAVNRLMARKANAECQVRLDPDWTAPLPEAEPQPIAAEATEAQQPATPKTVGKRQAIVDQAAAGVLPRPPDFSKPTHSRFRAKLAKLVELAEAGDIEGLKAVTINPVSTSPKAMARYRDLAVTALEVRQPAE